MVLDTQCTRLQREKKKSEKKERNEFPHRLQQSSGAQVKQPFLRKALLNVNFCFGVDTTCTRWNTLKQGLRPKRSKTKGTLSGHRQYLYISCENTQWNRSICLHTSTLVSKADYHWVCTLCVNTDCLFNCYSWMARCDINTRTQDLSLIPNVCLELAILIQTSLTLRLTARMFNIKHDSHAGGKGCLYQAYSIRLLHRLQHFLPDSPLKSPSVD